MTKDEREEAIRKLEYSKKAYQMLIDEKVDSGKLVGKDVKGEWKADTPLDEAYKSMIDALDMAIKALEKEQCEDVPDINDGDIISRQAVWDVMQELWGTSGELLDRLMALPPVKPQIKTGHCKDCKWWKDSNGLYRRGSHAESKCPINRREVFEGNGYCYMYEPHERSKE